MSHRIAADIGGTFTDLVLVGEAGQYSVCKTPSTPASFDEGVLIGVRRILAEAGVEDLRGTSRFVHGATVVLNALLQLKLPATGLITTKGFRDVLEIMRTNNPEMYDLQWVKPAPLVPRRLRFEVNERVRHTGEVLVPLDGDGVRAVARQLAEERVDAVAVCLLHAYANPVHERQVAALLREELPGCAVSLSSDVAPEWREFERTSTTCVNAATTPIITSYLDRLASALAGAGLEPELLVMQSNGGVMGATAARRLPVRTVMSGPSGGVVGASEVMRELGVQDAVTIDIGGTSSDVGLIAGGDAVTVAESVVGAGWPILAPMIEILSIGAGGGSIAWLDTGGALRVGPHSAGADPAPACYGRGGEEPTVTDAHAVLGRLDPSNFLGGEMTLDVGAAEAAIGERVAEPLGLETTAAAAGITRIANATMGSAIRSILIERGHDPRDFLLVAFGGGGGLHAAELMRDLGLGRALVPSDPGALSALGMLTTDIRHDRSRTFVRRLAELDGREAATLLDELERAARAATLGDGGDGAAVRIVRSIDARYAGQEHSLNVAIAAEGPPDTEAVAAAFHTAHERAYGYAEHAFEVELVNVRVAAIGAVERPRVARIPARVGPALRPRTTRPVCFPDDGWLDTPIYDVADVCAGDGLPGPAVLQDPRSTMLILRGQRGEIDALRNLQILEEAS